MTARTTSRPHLGRTLAFASLMALGAGSASAEPDLFGREGLYDLTGDPVVHELTPDFERVHRELSYADELGRVGAPTVEIRPSYIYVHDADGELPIPFRRQRDLSETFDWTVREVYQQLPDEFVFIYMFTSFETGVGAFFYAPLANDVTGINAQGVFDRTGASPLEGYVFMNYWLSFQQLFGGGAPSQGQARSVFNQEAGHRWGAFTPAGRGGVSDLLLGRDDSHWSYFMHTGGSPMEGNTWRDNGNGTFTTATGFDNWRFSDLDLYLMGLLPSNEVEPWFVIGNPDVGGQRDLFGQRINDASSPQIARPVTISGDRIDFTIDDVINRNGTRRPAYPESPDTFRVVFVMLASQNTPLSETEKQQFGNMVDDYADAFYEGTRERGTLDYRLREPEVPLEPIGGICDEVSQCDPNQSNFCIPNPFTPQGICTASCDSPTTCPVDWCCSDSQGTAIPVCLPTALCPANPNCACDLDLNACDEGCACDTMCGGAGGPDAGVGVDGGGGGGGGGGDGLCPCDVTFSCDLNSDGDDCPCDPECDAGCGCTGAESSDTTPLAGLAAVLVAGVWAGARRRRRR